MTLFKQANAKHAVVLIHGLCGTPMELGSIPKALNDAGYHVHTCNITNYTATSLDKTQSIDWNLWHEYVDEAISQLLESYETVSLCGLSMGATLALAVASKRDDINSIALLSPVLRYDGWAIKWYENLMLIPYLLGIRHWSYKESEPFGIKNIELRRRVIKSLEKDGVSQVGAAEISARHLYTAQKMMKQVRNSLEDVATDVLCIHAIDDETAAPRNTEEIMAKISSETKKVVWLGDCYHIITVDNEREIVTNEVLRFIQKSIKSHENEINYRKVSKRSMLKDRR
ncbi:alpha/beta fold hydrolase [Polynucleobacter sp. MWH-Spelu-300-X4]|uniref:alpha/beta hydrolase n=1 Tax=Polynucleobacter sp. MWH-Spelu-300-X4 TaxID=2689109 RepID=UPI001BFDCDA5|nr:alpha/beta fold hydrolase [Polynucleobacter sp. MWH-Spelu-300-X4]QWD79240.1 alpha/beta fold hydrolase [Polynucleobacter sp. MWH-Spelu-300-X4]